MKALVGGSIPSSFPGTMIEMIHSRVHLLPGHGPEIRLLREKLAKQAVGIFIDPAFPGTIRMGKVNLGGQALFRGSGFDLTYF